MREPGSGTRQAMDRFFTDQGIAFQSGMQMTRNEAIKQSVRAGLGLSLVSLHTIELELATGKLVVLDVVGLPIQRQWYLVYRRGKRLSPSARAFRQFVLTEARRMAAGLPSLLPTKGTGAKLAPHDSQNTAKAPLLPPLPNHES